MTETIDRVYFGGKGYQPLPWHPLPYMDQYLAHLSAGDSPRSPGYLRPVKVGLAHFAAFAGGANIVHPDEISRAHVLRFQAYLMTVESQRGQKLGLNYQGQLMRYLRGWLGWLHAARYISANPWSSISIRQVMRPPRPLEDGEIADLLDAHRRQAFATAPAAFHRREVILVLLFGWGLRIRELESLNVGQLAVTRTSVTIRDKNGATRRLDYGPPLKASVERWLRHRSADAKFSEDALLIDQRGGRLSVARIRGILVDCAARAGVTISPHRLGDTLLARVVDTPMPVERILELMGYTDRGSGSTPS